MNHLTTLYIYGKDAKDFLQGQITSDINLLQPLKAQPSACCNLQGRIVALFFIMIWKEGYLLLLPKDILKNTLKHFKKYAIFSKIIFEQNPDLIDLRLVGFLNKVPDNITSPIYTCFDNLFITETEFEENKFNSTNQEFELDSNSWHYQQMIQGFPNISSETQESFLPHRIGLQNLAGVLSFKKGCYLGQEIIARTHFKATLKHAVVLCDAPIGEVIDSAISPDNITHFLCIIPMDALAESEISKHALRKY